METGKRSGLSTVVAISAVLFLVFDGAVLGLGYWIARQVEADAVTINLAGRQRMLTQRMVKTLLQIRLGSAAGVSGEQARAELLDAVSLFDATLNAFARGGSVPGGDRVLWSQAPVSDDDGVRLIQELRIAWAPYRDLLLQVASADTVVSDEFLDGVVALAGERNLVLLGLANRFTSHVELLSRERTQRLRVLQVIAFVLALTNFFIMLRNILKRVHGLRTSHERAQQAARKDPLTGLPNRTSLLERLDASLAGLARDGQGLVVCFIDLDGFKQVNDRYGHPAGDNVLRQVARRIHRRLRRSDMIARIGGDEFVVILYDIVEADEAASILDALVAAMLPAFGVDDDEVNVGLSIGAILVRSNNVDAQDLLRRADHLMYEVKRGREWPWRLMELVDGPDELVEVYRPARVAQDGPVPGPAGR